MTEFLSAALWTTTITASAAALVVMALRLALKKLPWWLICVLWLPVFLRMVCPWGLPLPVSLVPAPVVQGIAQPVLPVRPAAEPAWPDAAPAPAEQEPAPSPVLLVWAIGAAGMLAWTGGSAWRLRRRLAEAVQQEKGVYESDRVDSPFLLGWLRPRIYLPVGLPRTSGSMCWPMSGPTGGGGTPGPSCWPGWPCACTGSILCCGWPIGCCAGTWRPPVTRPSSGP